MKELLVAGITLVVGIACGDGLTLEPSNADEPPAPPEFGVCGGTVLPPSNPAFPTDATLDQIAATPREELRMEALALRMTGGFIADQGIYERVVADMGAIRSGAPELDDIRYTHSNDARTVMLRVSRDTLHEMQAGTYTAWDNLNDRYGVVEIEYREYTHLEDRVLIQTKGLYDVQLLSIEYAELPDVIRASPNWRIGDASTICGDFDGQTFHYLFDRASGDCLCGCIWHDMTYFECEPNQTPQLVGEWQNDTAPEPDWLRRFRCY